MFFGNSRISFIKNLISLIGDPTENNYVITFIDEATTDYTNGIGTTPGPFWDQDVEYFRTTMEGRNVNSFVVFDIEAVSSDYIWAENNPQVQLPFPRENIVNIFRPNQNSQQQFFENVLENLESRWGTNIWDIMAQNGSKFLIVVDNSGSMSTELIEGALNSLVSYVQSKGVSVFTLEGCQNERWLAWGSAAYIDGENAGCSAACNWGKLCSYRCTDTNPDSCYGSIYNMCIPAFVFSNGSVVQNECPSCEELPLCPNLGQISVGCTSCEEITDNFCQGCTLPTYCNTCGETGEQYFHKCVKCHYLASDQIFEASPLFVYGSLTACGIASCSVTSGTNFGSTAWDGSDWSWTNAVPGLSGPTLFGTLCHLSFEDSNGNCGVCPMEHPNDEGSIIWMVELCDDGCTDCGSINNLPQGGTSINSSKYNVCLLGCTE
jgi:hypothetical protein